MVKYPYATKLSLAGDIGKVKQQVNQSVVEVEVQGDTKLISTSRISPVADGQQTEEMSNTEESEENDKEEIVGRKKTPERKVTGSSLICAILRSPNKDETGLWLFYHEK
jgi:hypothetical protein